MKKTLLHVSLFFGLIFPACTSHDVPDTPADHAETPKADAVKNSVSIIEIPVSDLSRAIAFYQGILNIHIEEMEMPGVHMGIFPGDGAAVNVVLVKGADYTPSLHGAVVYLSGGDDLQAVLDKVEAAGGKILVPKTEISAEMGFFALFTDPEGNKLGLHSPR